MHDSMELLTVQCRGVVLSGGSNVDEIAIQSIVNTIETFLVLSKDFDITNIYNFRPVSFLHHKHRRKLG